MPQYDVCFEISGFTDDTSLDGFRLGREKLNELNADALRNGLLPEGAFGLCDVSAVQHCGLGASEDDTKMFVSVWLVVDAPDEPTAKLFPAPVALLERTLALAFQEDALAAKGSWSVTDSQAAIPFPGRYALFARPADLGTIPKAPPRVTYSVEARPPAGRPHHDMCRHGILVCPTPLSLADVRSFELAPMIEAGDMVALAAHVASNGMADYAAEYVLQSEENPEMFLKIAMDEVKRRDQGVRYSVSDPELFAVVMTRHLCAVALEAAREEAARPWIPRVLASA